MANGIFGLTPGDVRAALERERLTSAQMIGQMGATGRGALLGGILGQGFRGPDPRLRQAQALEQINQELTALGLEPGDPRFTAELVPRVRARLGLGPALQAQQMALQAEQQQQAVRALRTAPEAQRRTLERLGYAPDEAAELEAAGIGKEVAKARLTRDQLTPLMRNVMAATGAAPGTPAFQAAMKEAIKRAPLIQQNIGQKAAEAVAVQAAKAEEAQGREATEVQRAVSRMRSIGEEFASGGVFERGAAALTPGLRRRWTIARRRAAKAIAQLRNPGNAEAAGQAEDAIFETLPDAAFVAANPAVLDEIVEEFEIEAEQSLPRAGRARVSRLGNRRIEDLTPEDLETMTDAELEALVR